MIMWDTLRYSELIEYDNDLFILGKVRFLKDFGPWRFQEDCARIKVDFNNLMMYELTEIGTVIRTYQMRLV